MESPFPLLRKSQFLKKLEFFFLQNRQYVIFVTYAYIKAYAYFASLKIFPLTKIFLNKVIKIETYRILVRSLLIFLIRQT